MSGHDRATTKRSGRSALSDAGTVLSDSIAEQHRALVAGDAGLRRGDDSVIHATRVATRRLRSIIRVFGRLFQASRAHRLDAELRWWAGVLGEVRDRQVLQARLDDLVDSLEDTPANRAVKQRIDDELARERSEHWARLQQALDGDRYLALLAEVRAWAERPPRTGRAKRPAPELVRLAHRADQQVGTRLKHANRSGDVDDLHRARKAAKRARYAAEAAVSITGRLALKNAKRFTLLQDLLGEHQDSVVSAELLRRLGTEQPSSAAEAFTFGLLHEREQQLARTTRAEARRIAKRYR